MHKMDRHYGVIKAMYTTLPMSTKPRSIESRKLVPPVRSRVAMRSPPTAVAHVAPNLSYITTTNLSYITATNLSYINATNLSYITEYK